MCHWETESVTGRQSTECVTGRQSVSLGDGGQSEDRRGGAALSGSGSQLLSQLSDLLHQISLAAVQLGPTSVQGNCQESKKDKHIETLFILKLKRRLAILFRASMDETVK